MEKARQREYLEVMGIQDWVSRDAAPLEASLDAVVSADPGEAQAKAPEIESTSAEPSIKPTPVSEAPAGQPDMPPWMEDVPPLVDDFAPMEGDDVMPPGLEPAHQPRNDVARLDWPQLEHRVAGCEACELHASRTNTVFGVGNRSADLLVIGEAPGVDEDRQGEPFVGRAGQLLNAMLKAIGLQRDEVYIANILKCRPPGNRDPRIEEAVACEPYLKRQVALIQPKAIMCVGRVAAQNLLKSEEAVGRMRGREFHYDGIPVVVTYHPAYLLRSPDQKGKSWQDLQAAVKKLRL
ncbi:uracil-DNA glycosylase [Solemya velesiana gill symbiont]|uniref:Type-4 uracil-DNA glycosylase n=1 Tax=Solemya velesiana gill symbiont TaxID=1918948 RepID=A0A1T2KRA7_9GAMM|nr:uracil-DNA glycosylase [Solemya velesiana gill symbiont]OOZ35372.1 uracil-DNA glycosylase [Solemya velesiana gill symbiont]